MRNEMLVSQLYLNAVLPQLEEVAAFDPEFKSAVAGWNCSIQMQVSGGPVVKFQFRDGKLESRLKANGTPSIGILFPSPQAANKTFEKSGFAVPIIWRGFTKLGKLMKFLKLADKLEAYLKPDEAALKDEALFNFHVRLMLMVGVYGIKAVGENDPDMKALASHTPDGVMEVRIGEEPIVHIGVKNGKFTPGKGAAKDPAVIMELRDVRLAYDLINGKVDAMGALGACEIRMIGFLPLADNLNVIMEKVGNYLE